MTQQKIISKTEYEKINNQQIERINRAKIQLQISNSFFGRIILTAQFKMFDYELYKQMKDFLTIGINVKCEISYNPLFIQEINDSELIGLITHEILHYILLHHFRLKNRIPEIANISQDIVINSLIKKDTNYQLPTSVLIPKDDEITLNFNPIKIKIKKCSTKTDEMIYYEIINELKKNGYSINNSSEYLSEKDKDKMITKEIKRIAKEIIDNHFFNDNNDKTNNPNNKKYSKKEIQKLKSEIEQKVREAIETSKLKGDTPLGIERMFKELHKELFNWKELLNKYITSFIPFDKSYKQISKKSYAIKVYLPNTDKENINVVVLIDVSGSISSQDLTDFLSEIKGILTQFKDRINIKLYTHETNLLDTYTLNKTNDIKNLKIKGGGGTSFNNILKELNEKEKDIKILIWLSDGYGDNITIKHKYPIIWVLTEHNSKEYTKSNPKNKTLILENIKKN